MPSRGAGSRTIRGGRQGFRAINGGVPVHPDLGLPLTAGSQPSRAPEFIPLATCRALDTRVTSTRAPANVLTIIQISGMTTGLAGAPNSGQPWRSIVQYTVVAFYITAHEDDWELFRGEQAYADIQSDPSYKIVFIHTTAGDAGSIDGWWEAREQGAITAVRAALPAQPLTIHVDHFNGHPVQRYTCANTTIYFMRLPDGSPDGTGYPSTNHQSLSHLRDSNKPIVAVDRSTIYTTWSDFCDTLSAMVRAERQGVPQEHPWINAGDYSASTNPGDHADHKATGDAVRSFARAQGCNRAWFLTYVIASCSANLGGAALLNKKRTFDAYGHEVLRVTTLGGSPVQVFEEWTYWGEYSYVRLLNWDQPDNDNPLPATGCPGTGRFIRAAQHPHGQPPRRVLTPRT
jgi:hypothetical protein